MTRPIYQIAREVRGNWPKVNYAAKPYLDAMFELSDINDKYYLESGRSIVRYFLANAASFKGDKARELKAELKAML